MRAPQRDVLRRLSAARTALVLDHPFFGALALKLIPVESTGQTETAATDGRSLFYDPVFVAKLSDDEVVGLLAHEVMHCANLHHVRRSQRDPRRWNEACDHAINSLILEAGLKLPQGGLFDPQYAGLSAEQIYDQLPEPQQGGGQGGGNDAGVGDMPGAVLDAPEAAQEEADWKVAVTQAANAAKMMGRLPASIQRLIEHATQPRVDWKALLRRFVQQCATSDYSWRRPNPRYLAGKLYLPQLRSESMPPIVVAVDTSGSIDEATLAAFRAELQSILEECQPESTHVIYCDAEVQRVDVFERGEPLELHPEGGGGTDFCPVFTHIEAEQLQPACAIYLTDGAGYYPDVSPDYPVLWAMTTSYVAPWGESIAIGERQ